METKNPIDPNDAKLLKFRGYLLQLAVQGGPAKGEHLIFTEWLRELAALKTSGSISTETLRALWRELGDAMTSKTMQGFAFSKPHGYSGDYEIIERVYSEWTSPIPNLVNWDFYAHAQPALKAVRNRKRYFRDWIRSLEDKDSLNEIRVLNVGSGPARDVFEYFIENPESRALIECVDHDAEANAFAAELCKPFAERIIFHHANALRFHPPTKYRVIWSAGLFDYLTDGIFVLLLSRLWRAVEAGGELALGNFSTTNPTRPYMELVGEWFLNHRTAEELTALAQRAGLPCASLRIESEPEGVNLFLHARKD